MEGFGFSDTNLEKFIVNSHGETFFQVHQKTVKDFARHEGFCWLLRYNKIGKVTEIEVLPFQNCRLGIPDSNGYISKIYYNPFFGTVDYKGFDKKSTIEYDVYNPEAAIDQINKEGNKFKGQVLFCGTTTALSPYYPIPEAYSAAKWMKIESGVSDYHEDNLNNGFLQPFMLIMRGNPSEPSNNPELANHNGTGKPATIAQEFDIMVSENFMGAKRVGNMFVQWVNNNEEAPTPVALPSNNNGDLFLTLDNQATKKITVAFKVPAILANINEGVSLGGDGNAVRVAVKLMQQRVIKKQRVLTDFYSKVLGAMMNPYMEPITIVPYNPYPEMETIDPSFWEVLTDEEKRKYIQENTDIEIIEEPDPTVITPPLPAPPAAKLLNKVPVSIPDKARENARRALEFQDKMGFKCSGRGGRELAQRIADNANMGHKELKRIHSYLKKNEKFKNSPYNEGCSAILYQAWGGYDMFDFLDGKLKEIEAWLN